LELCEARDPKGLYKLACEGKIKGEIFIQCLMLKV
jgi:adenylylsulfate kinase-like enzyme